MSDAAEKKTVARKKTKSEHILRVAGPERGRRRAGHHFGAEVLELRIEDLTEEQVAAIQADPLLTSAIGTRTEEIEAEDA